MARKLTDMQFDEVSLVDRAANQFADVLIAKSDGDAEDYDAMEEMLTEFSEQFAKAANADANFTDDEDDDEEDDDDEEEEEGEEEETSKAFPPPEPKEPQQPQAPPPAAPPAPAPQAAPAPVQPGVPGVPGAPVPGVPAAPVPGMVPPAAPPPAAPPPQLPQVQLPPEVVQYIKALEARISALTNQQGNYSPMAQSQPNASQSEAPSHFNEGEGVRKMQTEEDVFGALAKMLSDADTDPGIASEISKATMELVSKAQARAEEAERIAKEERDFRLEQEYISKAANLALPISPEELGPVLKRMDDLMTPEDAKIIIKALLAGSEAISKAFDEAGTSYGAAFETLSKVDVAAKELVAKSGHKISSEQAMAAIYETDPGIYDEYLTEGRGN